MTEVISDFMLIEEYLVWKVKKLAGDKNAEIPSEILSVLKSRIGGEQIDDKSFQEWSENQASLLPKEHQEFSSLKRIAEISEKFKYLGNDTEDPDAN